MKVYAVELRGHFYVLAENDREAEEAAKVFCDFEEIEACLPHNANPYIDVHCIPNQSEDMRKRTVNYDENYHAVGKKGDL